MADNLNGQPALADKSIAQDTHSNNYAPFQTYYLSSPVPQRVHKPYTRLDAFTTGLCVLTGWLIVLALIYLGISSYNGGANTASLIIYIVVICTAGFVFKNAIALYFKHTLRTDLLPKKRQS